MSRVPSSPRHFSFATNTSRGVHDLKATSNDAITFSLLCICKQKNNDNSQSLTYKRNLGSSWMCPTHASLNIVQRATQLNTLQDHLASEYCNPKTGLC